MSEKFVPFDWRPGVDTLRNILATDNDASVLQDGVTARNLNVTEAAVWRISANIALKSQR